MTSTNGAKTSSQCRATWLFSAIRWGGILTSHWRWREGVGPRKCRKPMINYLWGGVEPNQVGVHVFSSV